MRGTILSCIVAVIVAGALPAAPVRAAPTCQTRAGDTIRCGTEGAMPVGWTIPPELRRADPFGGNQKTLVEVILGLGLFFAFVALLPRFDGTRAADWDRQEGEEER